MCIFGFIYMGEKRTKLANGWFHVLRDGLHPVCAQSRQSQPGEHQPLTHTATEPLNAWDWDPTPQKKATKVCTQV